MVLGLDQKTNLVDGAQVVVRQIDPFLLQQQARNRNISSIQGSVEGIPAALGVLGVEVDGRMFDKGADELVGIRFGRGGGAQQDSQAGMVAAVDFGSSEVRVGVLGPGWSLRVSGCPALLGS